VLISDGRQVRRPDGTLAGSALLLDECLKNVHSWLPKLPPGIVLDMVSGTPARLLGLEHKGRVAVGCDADLVTLDREWNVTQVFVRGDAVG
jgi:N-acetylglucosamine-6-phosphate deacetylase